MSIKTDALVIKNETIANANTATRVGTNLVAIADDLVDKQSLIDANTAKTSYTDSAAVALNTAKVGITPTQASNITANNAKISYTDATAVGLNTAKVGITPTQATNIVTNNAKVSNVSTALSVGTVNTTTVGITSDGSANDVIIPSATISAAGVLPTSKWAEIVSNTAKVSFDSTASTRLANTSGTNTGDQTIPVTGVDFDPVGTDNSDNNAANTLYSGLAGSKQDNISLTTTGTSGAATLVGSTLNIPQYAGGGTGDALVANPLSQFAATTKAQLDGVISDGNVMYIGDAPTAHTHTASEITDFDTEVSNNTSVAANTSKISFDSTSSTRLTNTSGTNTGDNAVNTIYSGLVSNVSTTLSIGTVGVNTVGITSDGGVDDVIIPAATVSTAGLLTTAKWDEIVALQSGLLTDSSTITVSRDSALTDADGMNNSTATSDVTITILSDAAQITADGSAFDIGTLLQYKRSAAGNVIVSGSGITTRQTYNLEDVITIRKTAANTWEYLNPPQNLIGQTAQSATGDGATTIDWQLGNMFNFQFGAFNETFTFTAPLQAGTFILKLVQDSVGSRTATFPASVKWAGGVAPTLTTTLTTGTDIITLYWDGTSYFCVDALNFS
jgi:hypothetical protein